jgi:hypothetical protein
MPTLKREDQFRICSLARRYGRAVPRKEAAGWIFGKKNPPPVDHRRTACRNDWYVKQKTKSQYDIDGRIERVFKWMLDKPTARTIAERMGINQAELLRPEFNHLVEQWRKDTRFSSSADEKILHPAYQSIIAMGKAAVPLMLEELQNGRGHLFWALRYMTGENPCPESDNANDAREAWLAWGRRKGLLN